MSLNGAEDFLRQVEALSMKASLVDVRSKARNIRRDSHRVEKRLDELRQLDKKYNNGYESASTLTQQNRERVLEREKDVMRRHLQHKVESSSSHVRTKAYADKTLRILNGG